MTQNALDKPRQTCHNHAHMTLETELYKNLRQERLGGPSAAARATYAVLIAEGHEPLPEKESVLKMIVRAEKEGAPKRSTIWPYYQRLLGIEEQRPAINATMAAIQEFDARLGHVEATLAELLAAVSDQQEALKRGSVVARLDEAQIRQLIEAVTGPFAPERFLKSAKQAQHVGGVGTEPVELGVVADATA